VKLLQEGEGVGMKESGERGIFNQIQYLLCYENFCIYPNVLQASTAIKKKLIKKITQIRKEMNINKNKKWRDTVNSTLLVQSQRTPNYTDYILSLKKSYQDSR
jgi:hypothetical protein